MLKACLKQKEFFYTFNLDMHEDGYSLPALSENVIFQFSIEDFELTLINKIPPPNENIPTKYATQKIKDYMKQDLDAGRVINDYSISDEVIKLLEQYNYRCIYCHIGLNYRSWSLDRVDNNIQHTYNNRVISCVECNVTRIDIPFKQFHRLEALKRYDKINPIILIISDKNKVLFEKLKSNMCGGLSLVFHRYHEKDVTYIQRCEYISDKWQLAEKEI